MNTTAINPLNVIDNQLTLEDLKNALPTKQKTKVDQQLVDTINKLALDDQFKEVYKDNIIGYTQVLNNSRYRITDYLNAVLFCSFHLMGLSKRDAYAKAFPDRYNKLIAEGANDKTIGSYVTMYSKGTLVTQILEQARIPTHILNAPLYQEAINIQAELMRSAKSEKVRSDAADSLMRELRAPETAKIALEVTTNDSAIEELRNTTLALAAEQKKLLASGFKTAKDVAHSAIIEGE